MERQLSNFFKKIAYKKLSKVEADSSKSNQHEFNGVAKLKDIFGTEKAEFKVVQIYLDDTSEDPLYSSSDLTWYDARENHETRTEYRLYYKKTEVTDKLKDGDLMVIAEDLKGNYLNIFAEAGSSAENQLKILFDISDVSNTIESQTVEGEFDPKLDVVRDFIVSKLNLVEDISLDPDGDSYLEEMLRLFPDELPSTKLFSKYARDTVDIKDLDHDSIIMRWWERETFLFKLYESNLFNKRIDKNHTDIDSFIKLSLSLQNTRKSRAGFALENHMEQLLIDNEIKYSRTPTTENNSKPDFIFPSIDSYSNPSFPDEKLHMLAVKTTCKDRWRQVLPEAKRISRKHLLTLEPGISTNQTDQMKYHNLTLVVPEAIQASYTYEQQKDLLTVGEFLKIVK